MALGSAKQEAGGLQRKQADDYPFLWPPPQCDRWEPHVQQGKVYLISKASLRNKRGNFNQVCPGARQRLPGCSGATGWLASVSMLPVTLHAACGCTLARRRYFRGCLLLTARPSRTSLPPLTTDAAPV